MCVLDQQEQIRFILACQLFIWASSWSIIHLNYAFMLSGLNVLRHHAGSPAFCCEKKKEDSPTFKKDLLISCTISPTNSMRGTPVSLSIKLTLLANQKLLLLNMRREIVLRATALMNGEEASGSRARRAEKAARRNGQRCHSSAYLHRKAI